MSCSYWHSCLYRGSYANGEDGIENIKNLFSGLFGGEKTDNTETKSVDIPPPSSVDNSMDEMETDATIKELKERNNQLQKELEAKDKELKEVKDQLETIKKAISSE